MSCWHRCPGVSRSVAAGCGHFQDRLKRHAMDLRTSVMVTVADASTPRLRCCRGPTWPVRVALTSRYFFHPDRQPRSVTEEMDPTWASSPGCCLRWRSSGGPRDTRSWSRCPRPQQGSEDLQAGPELLERLIQSLVDLLSTQPPRHGTSPEVVRSDHLKLYRTTLASSTVATQETTPYDFQIARRHRLTDTARRRWPPDCWADRGCRAKSRDDRRIDWSSPSRKHRRPAVAGGPPRLRKRW